MAADRKRPAEYVPRTKAQLKAHDLMRGAEDHDTIRGVMAFALQGNTEPIEAYISKNLNDMDDDDLWAITYLIRRGFHHKPSGRPRRQGTSNQPLLRAAYWVKMKIYVTRRKLGRERLDRREHIDPILSEAKRKFPKAPTEDQILTAAQRGGTFERRRNGFILYEKSIDNSLRPNAV